MKFLLLTLLAGAFSLSLPAQNLAFYLDNSNGTTPTDQLTPFPSNFVFPNTPVGSASSVVIRVFNPTSDNIQLNFISITTTSDFSSPANSDFSVNGLDIGASITPNHWKLFTLNYTPSAMGAATGYMQVKTDAPPTTISTLTGNGAPPQITLSCTNPIASVCNGSPLQPFDPTPILFGSVLTTSQVAIQLTLTNNTFDAVDPQTLVSLVLPTNNPNSAFALGPLPSSLASGSSVNFTVTFAPGTASTYTGILEVGAFTFNLQGLGTVNVVGDISSVVVTYTDPSGVRLTAQPGTPINFGQVITGMAAASSFTFNIANPSTTIGPVAVPVPVVTGAGFAVSNTSGFPANVAPGSSVNFTLAFSPTGTGSYTGALAIGSRLFSIAAQSVASPIPNPSFSVDVSPLTSQNQAHLTINFAGASPVAAIGTLKMAFTPSISAVTDDPAVNFVSTSSRTLSVNLASGAQTATYNGVAPITFQTGTTAGTITFTLSFANAPDYSQSFSITPAQIKINSVTATRQSPNLVVTMTGYDNTYSAGQLAFTFYGTNGVNLTPGGISLNAASNFHQYFFTQNEDGGAFTLQLTFPVAGDVTQVVSVAASLSNSAGQTAVNPSFQ